MTEQVQGFVSYISAEHPENHACRAINPIITQTQSEVPAGVITPANQKPPSMMEIKATGFTCLGAKCGQFRLHPTNDKYGYCGIAGMPPDMISDLVTWGIGRAIKLTMEHIEKVDAEKK